MKVEILYYEISTQLESKLRAKLLKEDELSECYEAIKEKASDEKCKNLMHSDGRILRYTHDRRHYRRCR